ncbi:unnamed protein product [Gordionus sp. m RMFG-2023]
MWVTLTDTDKSIVEYATDGSKLLLQSGYSVPYTFTNRTQYIHRVTLTNLIPNSTYTYHCGDPNLAWSSDFTLTTFPSFNSSNWSPYLIIFGDMGVGNARALTLIEHELSPMYSVLAEPKVYSPEAPPKRKDKKLINAVIHAGDMAYDMHDSRGKRGDQFLRQIQPIASRVPYITCPGNHENHGNFTQYRNKFGMPGGRDMFFSFNLGPAHFISFSTEYYFFYRYGFWQVKKQYEWLEKDLKEANKPENKAKRPWIITFGHRPMYCSNRNVDDCTAHSSRVRTGIPFFRWYGLEELFYRYNVDLEIWAHEHDYERFWPVYNYQVKNGTVSSNPYHEPKAPVHIITGSAGCSEQHDTFVEKAPVWSAYRSLDYGYTKMLISNLTHLYLEQISVDKQGKIIDNFWMIKEKDDPYEKDEDLNEI